MTNRHTRRSLLLVAAMLPLALAACGSGSNDDTANRLGTAAPVARLVHAVPSGPKVTLIRNGAPDAATVNLDYKGATQYFDIATGNNTVVLRASLPGSDVASVALDAQRGHKYTFVALANSAGVDLLTIDDPFNKSLVSDNARLRFVNASPNARGLDLYVTAPGVDLATVQPFAAGVSYGKVYPASGTNASDLEGGTYVLRVTPTGSKTPILTATAALPKNADWLLLSLPATTASLLVPDSIRLLLVRSDSSANPVDEFANP